MHHHARAAVAASVLALVAGSTMADYTIPSFSVIANTTAAAPGSLNLNGASIPAGTYLSFEATLDWSAIAGDPWSDEAIWALVETPPPFASQVFYADPGPSPDAQGNGTPRTLTWSGLLDTPYNGGDPLYFWFAQTFAGSSANWNNISITLRTTGPAAPASTNLGFIAAPGLSTSGSLGAGEVDWYSFTIADITAPGGFLTIDTLGSLLGPDNDTEIGLYSSTGALIATNDDIDFLGGNLLSQLDFGSTGASDLAGGTYYLAVGAFNTSFGPGFAVTSTSTFTGSYALNFSTNVVPSPAGAALLAVAGLVGARRRRVG